MAKTKTPPNRRKGGVSIGIRRMTQLPDAANQKDVSSGPH
jgi:hypothetical protein